MSLLRLGIVLLLFPGLATCRETREESLERVRSLAENGDPQEARAEIEELLHEHDREQSLLLSDNDVPRMFKKSPDGSVLVWFEKGALFSYRSGQTQEIALAEALLSGHTPVALSLSHAGGFALLLVEKKDGCDIRIIDLLNSLLLPEHLATDCFHRPAIVEEGPKIYYVHENFLYGFSLPSNRKLSIPWAPPSPEKLVPLRVFKVRYKIKNRLELLAITHRQLLVFYGSAGYYDLYHYPGEGSEFPLVTKDVARPVLYGASAGQLLHNLTLQQSRSILENPTDPLFSEPFDALIYKGTAGRYVLQTVSFQPKMALGPKLKLPAARFLTYIPTEGRLLAIYEDQLCLLGTAGECAPLPLSVKSMAFFSGGLAYIDRKNRLYLRKFPFTEYELDLRKLLSTLE